MKKLIISLGDDESKKIESSFTVISCILPNGDKAYILFRDGETPSVFYSLNDLFDFFQEYCYGCF